MQGLKEAGIYVSLIESAQKKLSKDKVLHSNEINSDSTNVVDAAAADGVSSRKVDNKEPRIAVRNVLQAEDTDLSATPPQPPPVIDDIRSYI